MSREIIVSYLNSLNLIFIVASSYVFFYLIIGADFVVVAYFLKDFIIRFCEGRDSLVFII